MKRDAHWFTFLLRAVRRAGFVVCCALLAYLVARAGVLALTQPALSVSPASLEFTTTRRDPGVMTRTLTISNTGSGTFTWTVSGDMSGSLWAGMSFTPTTGVNAGVVRVSMDSAPFTLFTKVLTTSLRVSAEPTFTLNSPFTVPVSLRVLDDWWRLFLPVVLRDLPSPPASPTPSPTVVPPTLTPSPTPTPTVTPTPEPGAITMSFGLNFVNSAEAPAGELRFWRATEAGAELDRWPFYWGYIETSEGVFDWSGHDPAVILDVEHGLQLDAILMMPPAFHRKGPCDGLAANIYASPPRIGLASRQDAARVPHLALAQRDCTTPASLDQPVFTDGTDNPGPGKAVNPDNPWARFVYTTVTRYKPGGVVATQRGWGASQGVRVWEVWNEPDYTWFWNGNAADYARTVAVAYLAIKQADAEARVLLGGLSDVNERPNWLRDTLDVIATYPYAQVYGWYFDAVGVHSYAWSWATWRQLYLAQQQLDEHGITGKTLWLNECGVPVWDDYPGPTWDPNSPYRATMLEQADYVIQNAIYARWMNAEAVLHFQLYDDCGNGPESHDAFGLRRNDSFAQCYPSDEGARPSFAAYQAVTRYLRYLRPRWRWRPPDEGQEWLAFYDPTDGNRLVALWSRTYDTQTAVLAATSTSAVLVTPDGVGQRITPVGGYYTLTLPAATNRNTPTNDGSAPIGGRPLLLIEQDPSGTGGPRPVGLE